VHSLSDGITSSAKFGARSQSTPSATVSYFISSCFHPLDVIRTCVVPGRLSAWSPPRGHGRSPLVLGTGPQSIFLRECPQLRSPCRSRSKDEYQPAHVTSCKCATIFRRKPAVTPHFRPQAKSNKGTRPAKLPKKSTQPANDDIKRAQELISE